MPVIVRDKYIGYTNTSHNGMTYEVIDYISTKNVKVKFEDGTIVQSCSYDVNHGTVPHPTYTARMYKRDCHIGETTNACSGVKMTIIAFRTYNDIDVKFEDGVVVTHKNYGSFKKGEIKHPLGTGKGVLPSNRIGMKVQQKCGEVAEIIDYIDQLNVTVRFEDGTILEKRRYSAFKNGEVYNPNSYRNKVVGQSKINSDGEKVTIIDATDSRHVTLQFEDGTIIIREYESFRRNRMQNPNKFKNKYLNKQLVAKNQIPFKIIEANNSKDLTIIFETGLTKKITTDGLKDGYKIKHEFPYQVGECTITDVAYRAKDSTNYYYICPHCNIHDIGTIDEIKNHKCE